MGISHFLSGRRRRGAPPVGAVVVDHVSPPHPAHPPPAGGVQRLVHPRCSRAAAFRRWPRRPRRAALAGEVPERGHKRRLRPVGLHEPSPRGPVVGVPQARVEPHRPLRREGYSGFCQVLEVPDGDAVDEKGVRVHVEGGDGAGGVAGDELELDVDLGEEKLLLGLEAGAGGAVQGQGEEAALVEDLGPVGTPGEVNVLVEVAGFDGNQHAGCQDRDRERESGVMQKGPGWVREEKGEENREEARTG
ncbi:unnamed protein product [Spirodela intermedia]|uniref:Uncharacterized protein n=1 Tax=Spirodela intermedia TaxID=51605 RepID=A0A7I8IXL5_SPIIN|nr:unnamed protein product [Spirodela intermedia]CAA6662325.1 unnamed protein product [Spirodela intermedia]